jgi:AcrR family transcriptional regulator
VGSFYARFADKHALLDALYARYDAGLDARIAAWRASRPEPSDGLAGACRWVAEYLVESFSSRRHLLRALALHVRQRPEVADVAVGERRARQHAFLHAALLRERERIPDSDPERAVRSAVFLAASACRERVLFRETPHARQDPMSDAALVVELARQMLGYLLCPAPGSAP